ncbi:MAG: aspartate-semialdehyde dehydrogenase [Bdellovibrionales bacterium]|nr:aspartate-semialdehyde dehydrogenase [Bdellovibrionales bacterium]
MNTKPTIAIVGATGVVGTEMIAVLEELNIPISELRLLASENSAGEQVKFKDQTCTIKTLNDEAFVGVDIALFAVSSDLAEKYVPIAAESGALVIDNSSHFRMDKEIPLIVPEVNGNQISEKNRIIANPNCSTIQLVMILDKIRELSELKRVVVSTYQAVSGAGKEALDELWNQTLAIFNQKELQFEAFQHQIAFNCIPQISTFLDNGYTQEETKVIQETRKILSLPNLRVTCTAVRVPVFNSHAESVNVETEKPVDIQALTKILDSAEGVKVYPNFEEYPMQLNTSSDNEVHVGRIRKDDSVENGLNLWIVADNLRKGAALNAVQIADYCIKKYAQN